VKLEWTRGRRARVAFGGGRLCPRSELYLLVQPCMWYGIGALPGYLVKARPCLVSPIRGRQKQRSTLCVTVAFCFYLVKNVQILTN
jgi:hypothetical protein